MRLEGTITVTVSDDKQADDIKRLFQTEDSELANGRSAYRIERKDSSLDFIVTANDPTAMRAALNAITKVLAVYEKMEFD
ncbi:MAG: KEOPS complex subunit Pcc1 [Nanoarchaeota archaeon]